MDSALAEHIANVVCDDHGLDGYELFSKIGDMLVWYGATKDDTQGVALCSKMLLELQKAGLFEDESKESRERREALRAKQKLTGWTIPSEKERSRVQEGTKVKAKFTDGKWYRAVVNKLNPDQTFIVTYIDYGNSEQVRLRDLKLPGPEVSLGADGLDFDDEDDENLAFDDTEGVKLLPTPIRISDFGERENTVEAEAEAKGAEEDEGPSKRELRLIQKEKRKAELARQRDLKRKERDEAAKEMALKMYLSNSGSNKTRNVDIHVSGFSMTSPDGSKELLQNANFSLNIGRRYGLIGSNGVGKTTLLKCFAHYEIPGLPTHLRIVHVEQECRGDNYSALQTVMRADVEREVLIHEEKRLKRIIEGLDKDGQGVHAPAPPGGAVDGESTSSSTSTATSPSESKSEASSSDSNDAALSAEQQRDEEKWMQLHAIMSKKEGMISDPEARLEQVYARMQAIDAWTAEARAAAILAGLQFTKERMNMPTKSLSGGWRMRVSLAASLFAQPDLLLLDEPTNHLDFPAVLWLEEYLLSYPKTLVVISHDRVFLNNVITDVLHLYHKSLTTYRGDYTTFEKVRHEQIAQRKREFEAQEAKKAHIQEFIDKFRYSAARAALVQSRIKSLNKMEQVEEVEEDAEFKMEFPSPQDYIQQSIVEVKEVDFSYNGKPPYLLQNVNAYVGMDSRVGVLGANGVGKSTLINLIVGKLTTDHGLVHINSHARIATFAQHHMDKLKPELSPLELLAELFPKNHPQVIRRHLGKFGVNGAMQTQIISSLSGGQKSRVAFSILTWDKPHVLIMDEPTNHLDLETVDALIEAVRGFKGGLVVVSHDQHFLASVCKEFWSVSDGNVKRFNEFTEAKKYGYSNVAKA